MDLDQLIDRRDFPELDLILWDNRAILIEPEDAFRAYETRWRFVHGENLETKEQQLIEALIKQFGNGIFLTA